MDGGNRQWSYFVWLLVAGGKRQNWQEIDQIIDLHFEDIKFKLGTWPTKREKEC